MRFHQRLGLVVMFLTIIGLIRCAWSPTFLCFLWVVGAVALLWEEPNG